jgi:cell division protein FtsB
MLIPTICTIIVIYCLLRLSNKVEKAEQEAKQYKEENERLKAEIERLTKGKNARQNVDDLCKDIEDHLSGTQGDGASVF